MAYTIEAAITSGCFDEVMVSTDSEKYADIAKHYGASIPFLRTKYTSSDNSSTWDTVREVLDMYKENNIFFDSFCVLQPTSPLRTSEDIFKTNEIFKKSKVSVVSVCEMDHSPLLCGTLNEDNSLNIFISRNSNVQRQKQQQYYRINGAIYFVKTKEIFEDDFLYREGSFAYIMPKERSIDIDSIFDFKQAEFLMKV